MNWLAQVRNGGRSLVVQCDNWADARTIATRLLRVGREELTVTQTNEAALPDIELRWLQSPGPPRRMLPEVRQRFGETWGPWKDERDFVLEQQS